MRTWKKLKWLGRLLFVFAVWVSAQDCIRLAHGSISGCGDRLVAIIVEPALESGIRSGLNQFEMDLCAGGYDTVENTSWFADPPAVRDYLRGLYLQSGRTLAGTILVGDIPHPYQWVVAKSANPIYPDVMEEVISFQYYSDLDGIFGKSAAYNPPHTHSFDLHYGKVEWEIWVGLLPRYNGDLQQTITAIERYFAKNHAYRTGQLQRPEAFLEVTEHFSASTLEEHETILNNLRTGTYSWTPYSNSENARLYFDSPPAGISVEQGYDDMFNGVADFTVQDAHGYWGTSGQLTIATVESTPVRTLFFWSNGCAVGNLDYTQNVLTSFLYSTTSEVLVAKGTTNNSGGMGNNSNGFFGHNVASALADGGTFGDALMMHVNVPLIYPWSDSREFHLATSIMLGDPTLRHRGGNLSSPTLAVATTSLPQGTLNRNYTAALRAANGTPPYQWRVITGTLPSGLELNSTNGVISGTPTESGDADFTIGVEDANLEIAARPLSMSIVSEDSDILIDFGPGAGLWVRYNNTTWTKLHSLSPEIIATGDLDGNGENDCIIDFGSGIGLYVLYNNTTWAKLHNLSPEIIATGDLDGNGQDDCIIDFGSGIGVYVFYNNTAWVKLHDLSPEIITAGDLDGNGRDDCIMDFGSGIGVYVLYNNTAWAKLHSLNSAIITAGDLDGNGLDDAVIDFGADTGIWVWYNNATWTKLHNLSSEIIAAGDLDGNGRDEIILDFGTSYGTYVLYNNAGWTKLHSLGPKSIRTGELDNN